MILEKNWIFQMLDSDFSREINEVQKDILEAMALVEIEGDTKIYTINEKKFLITKKD